MANDMHDGLLESGRVLFTGNRELMINDLMQHLPDRYKMSKCAPSELDFIGAIANFQPHVVVICLMDESREAMRMYQGLADKPQLMHLPLIAIGQEDDCENFRKRVKARNQQIFIRPFDREQLLQTMDKFILLSMELEKSLQAEETTSKASATPPVPPKPKPASSTPASNPIEDFSMLKSRKNILVVDDDVLMLNTIKLFLQDLYEVTIVPSGKLALKYLAKKSTDLVLLDYMMPDLDGPAVLQWIRLTSPIPNTPVVFLTGVDDRDLVLRGLEFHPNGYLLKPVTREVLVEKVTSILLGL